MGEEELELETLLQSMRYFYNIWANTEKPILNSWTTESLLANQKHLQRYGSVREDAWNKYVTARDKYLAAVKFYKESKER